MPHDCEARENIITLERKVAVLESKMDGVEDDLESIKQDVKSIKEYFNKLIIGGLGTGVVLLIGIIINIFLSSGG